MLPHDYVSAPACLFCAEPERVELFEVWTDHTFMLETCCEGFYETLVQEMDDDPVWARELLRNLGIESFTGQRLRRLADDGCCGMVLDWQLQRRPVSFPAARIQHVSHRICVMEDGRIVETGPVEQVFDAPQDAYTRRLLSAVPALPVRNPTSREQLGAMQG